LALGAISLIGPLVVHIFLPVIPVIKAEFGISDGLAQLTFSIAPFAMGFATLVYGSLSDRYGRRPVLLSGLGLFLAGSAVAAAAPSVPVLMLGRFIQAIGAGCGVTLVRTIARDAYGPERLIKAIAYLTMFYSLGPMISPVMGGLLLDNFGWRSVFGFALLAGAAILAGAYFVVYETRPAAGPGSNGVGILRSYFALFAHLRFTAFVLQTGFSTGTFFVAATAAAIFMKDYFARPATEFGLYFLLFPAGYFVGNLISTRRSGRGSIEPVVLAGSLLSAVAVATQAALLLSGHVTPVAFFLPGFFITMAQGMALPSAQSGAIMTVPELAGTAAGVGVFMQMLCGAAFAQLYGLVADGTVGPLLTIMSISTALVLTAGALPFFLARRKRLDPRP
jgi:DHA1 family bicyclomycin/chloramphenicol resistance-like MFS transporter